MAYTHGGPRPVDRYPPTPPKSYADAVEHKERRDFLINTSSDIDEDLIKESPPRLSFSREPSSPRSLGEVLNDEDGTDSPRPLTPTVARKPVPGRTYADAATISPIGGRNSIEHGDRLNSGSEGSPKSPLRRMKQRIPSHTLDGGEREMESSLGAKLHNDKRDRTSGESPYSPEQYITDKQEIRQDTHSQKRAKAPKTIVLTDTKGERNHSKNKTTPKEERQGASDQTRTGNTNSTTMQQDIHDAFHGRSDTPIETTSGPTEAASTANGCADVEPVKVVHNGANGESTTTLKEPVAGHQETRKDLIEEEKPSAQDKQLSTTKAKDEKEDTEEAPKGLLPTLVSGKSVLVGRHLRWAPLKLPVQRRLQTFMVLLHTVGPMIAASIFCFTLAIPLFWPLIIPYLIYIMNSEAATSGTLNYRSERFRNSTIWEYFAGYFPATLHRTAELPPTRKYLFGYHPHGIISHGAFAAFATEALGFSTLFPGITNTLLTLESNFRIPFYREWILRIGLGSVSRTSCENLLKTGGPNGEGMGRAITIVVGGARESLDSVPEAVRLVLNCRKGFVRLAIRSGADLVPVFGFGENELYEQIDSSAHPWIHGTQMMVKRLAGFTVPLFHARGIFNYDVGLLPYRRPVNIVVGRPILVQTMKNPTDEYVDEIHEKYVKELLGIWETWKGAYGGATKSLEIIE